MSASAAHSALPITANLPHVFGAGFSTIEDALLGKASFALLFLMIFLKPLATSFTLGSGNSGGVFAPSLFAGAALGGAFGLLVERIFPGATAGPGAFATVGMAAVFAGAARAPFTAILIVFEMTNDYRLMVPLMAPRTGAAEGPWPARALTYMGRCRRPDRRSLAAPLR